MAEIDFRIESKYLKKYIKKYFSNIKISKKIEKKFCITDDLNYKSKQKKAVIYLTDRWDYFGTNVIRLPEKRNIIKKKVLDLIKN